MKTRYPAVLLSLALLTGFFTTTSLRAEESKQSTRVLILGFDGFSSEGWKGTKHPNLDQLFADGILSLSTRPVLQSVTMFNWTSHLTGSTAELHGAVSNAWTFEKHELPPAEKDEDGYYPSIFKILKDKIPGIKTAYYYNWEPLINPMNQRYFDAVAFEEDDQYSQNYANAIEFLKKNREHPQLVFLYTVHIDHAGHRHKWMSDEYVKAIEAADVAVGELVETLKKENLYEGTHFMVLSDHGGIEKSHGKTSPNEMNIPWGVVGPGILKNNQYDLPHTNANTSQVIAHIFSLDTIDLPYVWNGKLPLKMFVENNGK